MVACYFTCTVSELHTDDITVSPPEVKEWVDAGLLFLFGGEPGKPNTGKSLSLYIIRQITSAGPALSGYTQISHGLKMKSKSRPPLLLDVPTLPQCKNDVLCNCIHRSMRPTAVSLQRWWTGTSGITPDSPAGLSQRQPLQTVCCAAAFPWKIDGWLFVKLILADMSCR